MPASGHSSSRCLSQSSLPISKILPQLQSMWLSCLHCSATKCFLLVNLLHVGKAGHLRRCSSHCVIAWYSTCALASIFPQPSFGHRTFRSSHMLTISLETLRGAVVMAARQVGHLGRSSAPTWSQD